ncbi:hypothetical protein C8R46DRAFT_1107673 [Mycena filopes]|nr:hypothetical protein C8R46DRAFT_1107673 [Mycena filopes]
MHFNLLSLAALAAFASSVSAQAGFCPEASRFGGVTVSPASASPGQTIVIHANLTCAVQLGNTPTFLDYYIDGVSTHTISGPIQLARRTYDNSTSPPADVFSVEVPRWVYFSDATYSVRMVNSFARPGPTGESVITVGSISTGITIQTS